MKCCNEQSSSSQEGDRGENYQGYNEKKIPAAAISMSCF